MQPKDPASYTWLAILLTVAIVGICVYYVGKYLETLYVKAYQKPFFVHFYFPIRKLPKRLKPYLIKNDLYKVLKAKEKKYFEHRVAKLIQETTFVGRDGLAITDEMIMEVCTAIIQLTFGMRHYLLHHVNTVILYPSTYFSILNQTEHKGEFNPRSKALVFSWKHFKSNPASIEEGVNLGFHEITHAIHYNSIKSNSISAEIFYDTFLELEQHLGSVELRNKIIETGLLRSYAYTDKFEFIAVLVEVFMESPKALKAHFPGIYEYVRRMLNFRYYDEFLDA
ncbi:zinc-dependent peptidase [Aquimarina brevivitae]|uniref:Zinc-dependent peptidase n=1 Tax=Aquimarina brevivitae TaxID=323412 RepID=A0A4Q7NXB5_9FLAO|nr:zinc-dependent peptidase [Aquimarina brevivitae]RZS92013.1 hypothetical protein EV197_3122 [Aquimarina brevivitae]